MRHITVLLGLTSLAGVAVAQTPAAAPPLLLQHPSLSATQIAFDYAGEIWTVPRDGGRATRLVTGQGMLSAPVFSPDGSRIAFTGRYDGNTDVYVVSANGGEPKRLTWHPGADMAVGWTPDGKSILYRTPQTTTRDLDQLYTVPADGGAPVRLPLPSGIAGSYSPDGSRLAYQPINQWEPAWKNYRGGQTARIWLADLATSHVTPIPRPNSNDSHPMWIGNSVYFLSDRDGPKTLYAYDVASGTVSKRIDNAGGFDMASASAGPGGIVIDGFGKLEIFDPASGQLRVVPVTINADLPQLRPHYETLKPDTIAHAVITASGKRVVMEVHGEILSAPAEKGEIRNLTQSPGVADRDPAPSPDGQTVAYFSDESGEYALHIAPASGTGPVRKIGLGKPASFFYSPHWSPDGKKLVFSDKRLDLWLIDLSRGEQLVKVATDRFLSPAYRFDPAWSADSRWLTYTVQLPNRFHAAMVYSLDTGKATQVTNGLSDVASPRFDRSGKYLYFTATTSLGLGAGWLDMSGMGRAVDGAAYVMVLRKDTPSPIAPESDEENAADAPKPGPDMNRKKPKKAVAAPEAAAATPVAKPDARPEGPAPRVTIDFDGLDQRILALPIKRANFAGLEVGKEGIVYTLTMPPVMTDADYVEGGPMGPPETLSRFDLKDRKTVEIASGVIQGSLSVAADGSKLLFGREDGWVLAAGDAPVKPGEGVLKLDGMSVWVDPRAEWAQMYAEVWRIERDFLYDPKLHGLDLARARAVYARFLPGLGARQDLNTLFEEMTGQIAIGHMFINGGLLPEQRQAMVGLLGADYEVADGHWKISRILRGENWNPKLVAPLSQPGVDVAPGDFILAVNGRPVGIDKPIFAAFDGTAGKHVILTVGPRADGSGARQVTVVPVASEAQLRLRDWMEGNRRKVDQLSGGRLAYVYVPDTNSAGFENFNRYYFAQVGKQGAIIDERFNHGGTIADYIIDVLKRTPQMINSTREGDLVIEPAQAIFGPKVMIANEMSGSGGDALPWLFKKNHVGTLVGARTWGGLVGIGGYPPLLDGGAVTAPSWAIYGTQGQWEVENIGIAPDIDVVQDPELMRQGHDPQLEAAVAEALAQLAKSPPPSFVQPPAPDKKPVLPAE